MLKRICSKFNHLNFSLAFVGLMFFLPFIITHHRMPVPSFHGEWIAAVLGLIALIPVLRSDYWRSLKIPQVAFVFPGLAAIVCMQWMLGMLHSTQIFILLLSYLLWAFLMVFLGSYLRRELGWEKVAIGLAYFLLIGGLFNVVIVALQFAMQNGFAIPFLPKVQGYGAITQRNHVANYAALALASLMYLYAKGLFSLKKLSFLLALLLLLLSFTGSRSSWLYLIAFTVLAVGLQVNAMKNQAGSRNIRSLLRVSLLLIPAFALTQLFLSVVAPSGLVVLPTERLMEAATESSASARLQFWYDSWRLFMQSPWLGVGAGAMRWQSFMLLDMPTAMSSGRVFEHAHNLFLHLLAEMGVGAFLLVAAGLVAWLRGFKWRELSMETWWLLALLSVLFIHSMLEYPLWYAYFLGIAAVLTGAGDEKTTKLSMPQWAGRTAQVASSVLFAVATIQLTNLYIANDKLETWLGRAIQGEISANEYPQFISAIGWVHANSLLSPYAELMFATTILPDTAQLNEKLTISQSAMRFIPMRRIAYRHVLLLKLKRDHAGAVKQLNRTLIAHPGKFKEELETIPLKFWQDYLDVLSEARPIPVKRK